MPRLEARCPPFLLTASKILARVSLASCASSGMESLRTSVGWRIESSKGICTNLLFPGIPLARLQRPDHGTQGSALLYKIKHRDASPKGRLFPFHRQVRPDPPLAVSRPVRPARLTRPV